MLHRHEMLGSGGKIRVPLSETAELDKVIKMLRDEMDAGFTSDVGDVIEKAVALLSRLRHQVAQGYHRNPLGHPTRGLQFQAGTVIGQIGTDVHDIRYTHASDGKSYEHHFGGDVEVWAVQRHNKRDLLLSHVRGEPLWDEFF